LVWPTSNNVDMRLTVARIVAWIVVRIVVRIGMTETISIRLVLI
jgi:hypothetical protein